MNTAKLFRFFQYLALALVSTTFLNCGSTAWITKTDGKIIGGEILAGDSSSIYIKTMGKGEAAIPKSEITDIYHPGTLGLIYGGALTGAGLISAIALSSVCSDLMDQDGMQTIGVTCYVEKFGTLAIGVPLGISSYLVWSKSKANMNKPRGTAFNNVYVIPSYSFNKKQNFGVTLVKGF